MRKSIMLAVLFALSMLCLPTQAGVVYSFRHIVEKCDGPIELADGVIGEAQLFVEVVEFGTNQVLFTFTNTGPKPCSITDVYFDDGALLDIASIDNSCGGVSFSQGASPSNLPGGHTLSPPFVASYSADSDPPVQHNGVNPQEWLGIAFDLREGKSFGNVTSGLGSGELRIGIHVQGFESGGSESFVNNGMVPEPSTFAIIGLGLSATVCRRHRAI
jgi:hypothetical protein